MEIKRGSVLEKDVESLAYFVNRSDEDPIVGIPTVDVQMTRGGDTTHEGLKAHGEEEHARRVALLRALAALEKPRRAVRGGGGRDDEGRRCAAIDHIDEGGQ